MRRGVEGFTQHPLILREAAEYQSKCQCTQKIEAGRAELHRTLESVLVFDMRMSWNGIGNSLTRWLAVLRLGTAAGRATFLWFSDRGLRTHLEQPLVQQPGRRLGRAPPRFDKWRMPHRVTRTTGFDLGDYFMAMDADYRWSRVQYRRVAAAMAARIQRTRNGSAAADGSSRPLLVTYRCLHHTWACMQPMLEFGLLAPSPSGDPSALDGGFLHPPQRVNCTHEMEKDGFMVSWLASRTEPWIVLRLNEQTALEPSGPAAGAVLSGAWQAPSYFQSLSALAPGSRGGKGGKGGGGGSGQPKGLFFEGRRYLTHACGACLSHRAGDGPLCTKDTHGSRSGFRPSDRPKDPRELVKWLAAAQPAHARGMRVLRRYRRGPRTFGFATACEAYAVLRPRRWLQRAMLPTLQRLSAAMGDGPLIAVHLRSGFADWQWYSNTHKPISLEALAPAAGATATSARGRGRGRGAAAQVAQRAANEQWRAASSAKRLEYAEHCTLSLLRRSPCDSVFLLSERRSSLCHLFATFPMDHLSHPDALDLPSRHCFPVRVFESMLHDCTEVSEADRPCFNWRTPHGLKSPYLFDAHTCARSRLSRLAHLLGGPTPSADEHTARRYRTLQLHPTHRALAGLIDTTGLPFPESSSTSYAASAKGSATAGGGKVWRSPHSSCVPINPQGTCLWSMPMPGNGTLAAVLECAHRFARAVAHDGSLQARTMMHRGARDGFVVSSSAAASSPPSKAPTRNMDDPWGVLVLGDAPGFGSLVYSLPALAGRVVHTNDQGAVAHTTFTGSCPPDSAACLARGTVDPNAGWTRAMIDYYVGGLPDAFVSSLFSSFPGAVLRRSLVCCKERMHFGAMYSQQRSHRDKPMRNVDFLRAMMQTNEIAVEESHWHHAPRFSHG